MRPFTSTASIKLTSIGESKPIGASFFPLGVSDRNAVFQGIVEKTNFEALFQASVSIQHDSDFLFILPVGLTRYSPILGIGRGRATISSRRGEAEIVYQAPILGKIIVRDSKKPIIQVEVDYDSSWEVIRASGSFLYVRKFGRMRVKASGIVGIQETGTVEISGEVED